MARYKINNYRTKRDKITNKKVPQTETNQYLMLGQLVLDLETVPIGETGQGVKSTVWSQSAWPARSGEARAWNCSAR